MPQYSAPPRPQARIAALTHAARWLELRIAAPLAVVARVNMGDAHDVRGGSNGAQREPLTKGEPAAEATSAIVLALGTAADPGTQLGGINPQIAAFPLQRVLYSKPACLQRLGPVRGLLVHD
jgi:hypothetical protein